MKRIVSIFLALFFTISLVSCNEPRTNEMAVVNNDDLLIDDCMNEAEKQTFEVLEENNTITSISFMSAFQEKIEEASLFFSSISKINTLKTNEDYLSDLYIIQGTEGKEWFLNIVYSDQELICISLNGEREYFLHADMSKDYISSFYMAILTYYIYSSLNLEPIDDVDAFYSDIAITSKEEITQTRTYGDYVFLTLIRDEMISVYVSKQ